MVPLLGLRLPPQLGSDPRLGYPFASVRQDTHGRGSRRSIPVREHRWRPGKSLRIASPSKRSCLSLAFQVCKAQSKSTIRLLHPLTCPGTSIARSNGQSQCHAPTRQWSSQSPLPRRWSSPSPLPRRCPVQTHGGSGQEDGWQSIKAKRFKKLKVSKWKNSKLRHEK